MRLARIPVLFASEYAQSVGFRWIIVSPSSWGKTTGHSSHQWTALTITCWSELRLLVRAGTRVFGEVVRTRRPDTPVPT